MSIEPLVQMAVDMKTQSVHEGAGIRVAKMALERMEQTGEEVTELMESGDVMSDPSLGSLVDVSA